MDDRPDRHAVAASYDLGVDAYVDLWSPVILPPARAVVAELGLDDGSRVVDIGTGSGALVPALRASASAVMVVGIDASAQMLRAARNGMGLLSIQADAMALPVRAGVMDSALLAYVLFHLSDPAVAVADAARTLRNGGRLGTVTWAHEAVLGAYTVWDEVLSEAGAPPLTARRRDVGLDSIEGIEALLSGAGLITKRIRTWALRYQWEPATYRQLAIGSGINRLRLHQLEPDRRDEVVARANRRLSCLEPDAFAWRGEVVCAVATKSM